MLCELRSPPGGATALSRTRLKPLGAQPHDYRGCVQRESPAEGTEWSEPREPRALAGVCNQIPNLDALGGLIASHVRRLAFNTTDSRSETGEVRDIEMYTLGCQQWSVVQYPSTCLDFSPRPGLFIPRGRDALCHQLMPIR